MKKYTSAVLLALNLPWKSLLPAFLVNIALQIFFGLRIIMPGGIPVTAAFVFERLLGTSVRTFGKWGIVVLLGLLVASFARAGGSKSIYTLNCLGLSEQQITFVFCFVFTGYFLLYWALQLAICYGFFLLFDQRSCFGCFRKRLSIFNNNRSRSRSFLEKIYSFINLNTLVLSWRVDSIVEEFFVF